MNCFEYSARITNVKEQTQRKNTVLACSCDTNGPPEHSMASIVLGGSRIQRGPGRPRTNGRGTVKKDLPDWDSMGRGSGLQQMSGVGL